MTTINRDQVAVRKNVVGISFSASLRSGCILAQISPAGQRTGGHPFYLLPCPTMRSTRSSLPPSSKYLRYWASALMESFLCNS